MPACAASPASPPLQPRPSPPSRTSSPPSTPSPPRHWRHRWRSPPWPQTPRPPRSQPPRLSLSPLQQPKPAAEAEPARPARAIAPAAPASDPNARRIWSVRSLVADIRAQVERGYTDLWVEGEISNCRPAPSGHIYFTLKDGDAQLPIVLFRRQAQLLRFRPTDGLAVLVRGRISVYESRGQLQLIAETMEPRGSGALQLAFEQLKQRLAAEGLFDAERKRPLPAFPRCVGIVTSPTGAVIRDIVTVVRRRHARLDLLVYPAAMQGANCPGSVAAGIRWFNQPIPSKVDLIVLARGGGSIEDLAGFNDEALARAIAASELPIVSAIGHETDFTIADFVADLRAPTPSAAAELVTAAQHRIEERVASLATRVERAARYQLLHLRQRYQRLSADQVLHRLRDAVSRRQQRLDDLAYRMESAIHRRLQSPGRRLVGLETRLQRQAPTVRLASAQHRLAHASVALRRSASSLSLRRATRLNQLTARLEALSPLAVLNRGYALVYLEGEAGETLLRSAAEAQPGQQIRARLASGSLAGPGHRKRNAPGQRTPGQPIPITGVSTMKKLFGTDGIRAVAGQSPLDPATVYAVGRALAHHLGASPRVLLGMDTRESSDWIAATLTAGLTSGGATVESAGVITTPAVAFLARFNGFSAGVVISASHNPWQDNGIKLFGPDGFKLPDVTEIAIEQEIFRQLENSAAIAAETATQPPRPRSTTPTAPSTSASSSKPSPISPSTASASSSTAPTEPPPPSLRSSSPR